jgi:DNA-binding response OmpR family regulator
MAIPKILIVDDDSDLRQALRLRLRANDYETVNAGDGYSAIAQAYKERPDLIILDLGLPVPATALQSSIGCKKMTSCRRSR